MAKQTINTENVASSAGKLRTANNNINCEFEKMQGKAKLLDNENWKSAAGEAARTKMYELFKGNEPRSAVLQNYVEMLEQQVNPNYIATESTNTKLADKFK
jgi:hypothetical protein